MNKKEYIVPKLGFLLTFIMAIVVYAVCLILNIVSLVVATQYYTFSGYWYLYVNIVVGIFVSLGVLLASILILSLTKDKGKGGEALMTFVDYYLCVLGVASFISSALSAISSRSSEVAIPLISMVFSILQIFVGIASIILTKKAPKGAKVVLLVECILFAVSNILNVVSYIILDDFIDMAVCLIVVLFDIAIVVSLFMMKFKDVEEKATTIPVVETKASEKDDLDLLLKYKDLLDKGILTQAEFDAKKKELL